MAILYTYAFTKPAMKFQWFISFPRFSEYKYWQSFLQCALGREHPIVQGCSIWVVLRSRQKTMMPSSAAILRMAGLLCDL